MENKFDYTNFGNLNDNALAFLRFSKNLRQEMSKTKVRFNGEFPENVQEKSIPTILLATVNIILYGTSAPTKCRASQPALAISQLLLLNYQETNPKGNKVRQNCQRQPPLPLYMALSVYGRTREKCAIEEMHSHGLSTSYSSILEITSSLSHLVVQRAKEEGVLCPSNLRKNLFTVAAYDNIDHNLSSTTAETSFHGTSISVFQFPSYCNTGQTRSFKTCYADVTRPGMRSVAALPESYALVPDYVLPKRQPDCSGCSSEISNSILLLGMILTTVQVVCCVC